MKHSVGRYGFVVATLFTTPVKPLSAFAIMSTITFLTIIPVAPFLLHQIIWAILFCFEFFAKIED
jgi:hypothetical protein